MDSGVVYGVKARLDNEIVFLDIHSSKLFIKSKEVKTVPLKEIKSLHTKNEETFLLRLSNSLVFSFENHNSRDLVKNILLKYIKPEEKVVEEVLARDEATRRLLGNTKDLIDSPTFWSVNSNILHQTYNFLLQQPGREMNYETDQFIYSLPPVFLRMFGDMNCSINQFYNYVKQSNFFDIRNPPNCIDRMLIDSLRDFKIETNYAVRLNSQSLVSMNRVECKEYPTIPPKSSEFEPIYYLDEENNDSREVMNDTSMINLDRKLSCHLELKVEKKEEEFKYDKKEIRKIVDLSRMIYRSKKANGNVEAFVEEIRKKYGEKNMKYLTRILPTFFTIEIQK